MLNTSIKFSVLVIVLLVTCTADAQLAYNKIFILPATIEYDADWLVKAPLLQRKLYHRNTGMIIGLQKGNSTSIELGGEAHWRKISFKKPHVIGATTNLEYNIGDNVLGYKAGMWMKRGRVNLTYGGNVSYFTNFHEGHRFGIGPSVGFRVAGLHLVNGYNFLTKDNSGTKEKPVEVNTLYMSLRYYFPVNSSFTWDRKTMQKKKERKKEKAQRLREKERDKEAGKKKNWLEIFKPKTKEQPKPVEEKKGVLNIFKKKSDS